MYDAVIIGAGPAGSSLALRLARRGLRIAIVERSRFPRTKVCGEYLSPATVGELRALGTAPSVAPLAHTIRAIELCGFGLGPLRFDLPEDGAWSLPRSVLDDLLLREARSAGAELVMGSYLACDCERDSVRVRYRDERGADASLEARALIGADGAWSTVAQRTGLARPPRRDARHNKGRWAVGGHVLGEADSDVLEMYAGRGGYFARNPLGHGKTNEMLVMPRPTPDEQTDAVALAVSDGRRQFHRSSLEKRVSVGPLRYRPSRVARGRIALVGDAAGLVDPFTGQGVGLALALSAPAAAAVESIVAGEDPDRAARVYSRAHRRIVGPRRALAAVVDATIRTPILRRRALRKFQSDPRRAGDLIAAVAGSLPASAMLKPGRLAGLFV